MMNPSHEVNIQKLIDAGKPGREGDVFVLRIVAGVYHFGRVIRTGFLEWNPEAALVYVYKPSADRVLPIPRLKKDNLLIPPIVLDADAWTEGYLQLVKNVPLAKEEVFPVHCFAGKSLLNSRLTVYFDESGARLKERTEPCGGPSGVCAIGVLDYKLSDALGIPRVGASVGIVDSSGDA